MKLGIEIGAKAVAAVVAAVVAVSGATIGAITYFASAADLRNVQIEVYLERANREEDRLLDQYLRLQSIPNKTPMEREQFERIKHDLNRIKTDIDTLEREKIRIESEK